MAFDCAAVSAREAARLLARLVPALHVVASSDRFVTIEGTVSQETFDRLCLWGSRCDDCELDMPEGDADAEDEVMI